MTLNECETPSRKCPVTNELLIQIGRIEQRQEEQTRRTAEIREDVGKIYERLDQAAKEAAAQAAQQPAAGGRAAVATIGGTIGAAVASAVAVFIEWMKGSGQ